MFEGGCQCGGVRYRVAGEILEMSHCHCSMCRRLHGAAFATYAAVRAAAFSWLNGADRIRSYASSREVVRTFCAECGSNLQVRYGEAPRTLYLAMGSVDGNPGHPEPFHIFVASKAPWHEITDDHPQYAEWRAAP